MTETKEVQFWSGCIRPNDHHGTKQQTERNRQLNVTKSRDTYGRKDSNLTQMRREDRRWAGR